MRGIVPFCGLIALWAASLAGAAQPTIDAWRWHRRVVLIAAPTARDAQAASQRRILSTWSRQGADRDVSLVEIDGERVTGVADTASALRRRYRLKPGTFAVLLIGKDGHVALRAARPIAAGTLEGTIDAMPMRKAGQR